MRIGIAFFSSRAWMVGRVDCNRKSSRIFPLWIGTLRSRRRRIFFLVRF